MTVGIWNSDFGLSFCAVRNSTNCSSNFSKNKGVKPQKFMDTGVSAWRRVSVPSGAVFWMRSPSRPICVISCIFTSSPRSLAVHTPRDTVPFSESVFAMDPFNPVRHSSVEEVIRETSEVPCVSGTAEGKGVAIFDASTDEDIRNAASAAAEENGVRLFAGCAGMAEALNALLELPRDREEGQLKAERLLVFCGSVNPISRAQCETAGEKGAPFFHLINGGVTADEEKIAADMAEAAAHSAVTLFDTGSAEPEGDSDPSVAGRLMARRIGRIIKKVSGRTEDAAVFIIGGDTLLAFTEEMGITALFPERELLPGVVAASYELNGSRRFLIAKSGGFGDRDLIDTVWRKIRK